MNLFNYWLEEKIKPAFSPSIKKLTLLGALLAIIFFYLGQGYKQEPLPSFKQLEKLPDVKLPEVIFDFSDAENADINADNAESTPSARLRLISANLIAIYEQTEQQPQSSLPKKLITTVFASEENEETNEENQPGFSDNPAANSPEATDESADSDASTPGESPSTPLRTGNPTPGESAPGQAPRLAGLRILGEYQNVGNIPSGDVQAIVRFFDENDRLLATKRAEPTSPFRFLPLEPNEISSYDILIPEPPPSVRLQIDLKPGKEQSSDPESLSRQQLKFKEKDISLTSTTNQGSNLTYYKFTGTMINVSPNTLTNFLVYVWLKDSEGKVFAMAVKEFRYDLLTPNQELEVLMPILPAKEGEMEIYEVKLWGEVM